METVEQIEAAALKLPRAERARLAERLVASLDEDRSIEAAWADEMERRVAELDSGAVKAIPGDEVFRELEDLRR